MNKIKQYIKTILALWPGIWAIPLVLIALWASYYLLALADPTAGVFDIGYLQALLVSATAIVVLNELVFLGIERNDKSFWKYYKDNKGESLDQDFKEITPWQRITVFYFWRAFLFLLLAATLAALI